MKNSMRVNTRKCITPTKNQRGAAIIVALFVVALVAVAATFMIQRLRIDVRRTELILNANQANLYAQGSIAWAIDQLNNNAQQQQPNKVVDKTPIHSPSDHQNDATITSTIEDAQGYFNINNLTDQQYQAIFMRLLQVSSPGITPQMAQNITAATIDWISQTGKNPLLDEYYLKQPKPYRAPHRPMVSASELRLVKDVTPELYLKLRPYLIALPNVTPININNAEVPVLMSLSPSMSQDAAKAIRAITKQNPFPSVDAFQNFDIIKNNPVDASKITITSNYFLVITSVKVGNQLLTLYSLLERASQGPKTKTTVLWQSKGTL